VKRLEYTVRFTTPAFLGDAEQSGRWRTPPLKALLRQWWRVAYAADHHFAVDVAAMRRDEGLLFGNAWLSHQEGDREVADHRKSLVRLRLDRWEAGKLRKWQALATIAHPEVLKAVGSDLYLGYGPITLPHGATLPQLKKSAAIQAGESATLSIAAPDDHALRIQTALWLMDHYGTLGGRSRNGWGSLSLTSLNGTPALAGEPPSRLWRDALGLDWPHAIGRDGAGTLVWTTEAFDDWKAIMRTLAIVKIGLRTQFVFPNAAPPHQNVQPRHWLSYPITKHTTRAWNRGARLPNSLRFKIRPDASQPDKLRGVIFHVPCSPAPEFRPDRAAISEVWSAVHGLLDDLSRPKAGRAYSMVRDAQRREALKPQLDTVTLTRIPE
jgi:CRISPR-associated protein Cmr1